MKAIKWKALIIPLGWLVLIILTILFFLSPGMRFFGSMIKDVVKTRQIRDRLLSQTDHHALLDACRKISKEVTAGNLDPNRHSVRYKPDLEISRFPQILLDTEPLYIEVFHDGRVGLEISGAFHHCGVRAYPENYKKPNEHFTYGDKKIIDGLWYYEDDYNPKYDDKWIESMLKKGKRRGEN